MVTVTLRWLAAVLWAGTDAGTGERSQNGGTLTAAVISRPGVQGRSAEAGSGSSKGRSGKPQGSDSNSGRHEVSSWVHLRVRACSVCSRETASSVAGRGGDEARQPVGRLWSWWDGRQV